MRFYQDVLEFPLTELVENRDYPGSSHFFFDIGNLLALRLPGLDVDPDAEVLGGLHHVAIPVEPPRWRHLVTELEEAGVAAYLALNNVGCVGGSWLTPADAVRDGDRARVTELAAATRG